MNKAIYPLSGDPVHHGHVQTVKSALALNLFDEVVVAVGENPLKKPLFSTEERVQLAKASMYGLGERIQVESFSGLLRNHARKNGFRWILRGSRNGGDFEYETTLADFNRTYGLETVVIPSTEEYRTLSSSYVRAVTLEGGFVHKLVHPAVKQALEERVHGFSLVGVTGNMGAGKSTLCRTLAAYGREHLIPITHIDFDLLVHAQYTGTDPIHQEVRAQIKECFGEEVYASGCLNRKVLAGIVFGDVEQKEKLSEIVKVPSLLALEEQLRGLKGIVLLDAAYLTEYQMLPLVNYNTLLVTCSEDQRLAQVLERDGITPEEVAAKTSAQHSEEQKRAIIRTAQHQIGHGFYQEVDTNNVSIADIVLNLNQQLGGYYVRN